MKAKIDKLVNSHLFIAVVFVLLMSMVTVVGTYAWFTWRNPEDTSLKLTIGHLADVTFTNGPDIDASLNPVFNYSDGLMTTIDVTNKNTTSEVASYKISLHISSIAPELCKEDVKYTLLKNGAIVKAGDFSSATDGSVIDIYTSTLEPNTTSYTFYLYIDSNMENDSSMMNKKIVGEITLVQV